jgi:hypothetical protein
MKKNPQKQNKLDELADPNKRAVLTLEAPPS